MESPLAFAVSPASSSYTLALSRTGPRTNLGLTRFADTDTDTDVLQRPMWSTRAAAARAVVVVVAVAVAVAVAVGVGVNTDPSCREGAHALFFSRLS